jgi:hypothetical protein
MANALGALGLGRLHLGALTLNAVAAALDRRGHGLLAALDPPIELGDPSPERAHLLSVVPVGRITERGELDGRAACAGRGAPCAGPASSGRRPTRRPPRPARAPGGGHCPSRRPPGGEGSRSPANGEPSRCRPVSNRIAELNYDRMLAWDPDRMPEDWQAVRRFYFKLNWIRAASTWTAFGLFLAALIDSH